MAQGFTTFPVMALVGAGVGYAIYPKSHMTGIGVGALGGWLLSRMMGRTGALVVTPNPRKRRKRRR